MVVPLARATAAKRSRTELSTLIVVGGIPCSIPMVDTDGPGGVAHDPCSASFVPPPNEFVQDLMTDLCEFSGASALPAVAQAVIAHGQF
jgi:Fic family protein